MAWIAVARRPGYHPGMSMADETFQLEFDGGSRGNPGPAGVGVVIRAADGTVLSALGRHIGRATNNVAEYTALITAMTEAKKLGARKIDIRGDSELVIKQMRGEYKVKNPDMRRMYDQAIELFESFDSASISHNLRHHNELADELVNKALDLRRDVTEEDLQGGGSSATPAPSRVERAMPATFECPRCSCVLKVEREPLMDTAAGATPTCVCGTRMRGK